MVKEMSGKKNGIKKVAVITLGCPKNIVDSEVLIRQLQGSGIEVVEDIEKADTAIVNTCGFIEPARKESLDTVFKILRMKEKGSLKSVYMMGCLVELYKSELKKEVPEIDGFFGTHELHAIVDNVGGVYRTELLGERVLTTPSHYAYIKISEGCDNPCSFCSIPLIRGKHISRPMDEILKEVKILANSGVKEAIVIGQDTTYYGVDRDGESALPELLQKIAEIDGIEWIRLMYAYPAKFPLDLVDVINNNPKICRYIDMPIQHISDSVLKSMRRGITGRTTRELITKLRHDIPGIAIRTTLIVGYPTETEKEFEELLNFVEETRFERLGVFPFSPEERTTSYELGDPVLEQVKTERMNAIMELQRDISEDRNLQLVGSTVDVIIDRAEGDFLVGRTKMDAPEIDNEVLIRNCTLKPGTIAPVAITESTEYDLFGHPAVWKKEGILC